MPNDRRERQSGGLSRHLALTVGRTDDLALDAGRLALPEGQTTAAVTATLYGGGGRRARLVSIRVEVLTHRRQPPDDPRDRRARFRDIHKGDAGHADVG